MKPDKKALIDAYKRKEPIGGIYCVECTASGRKWIKRTRDLESIRHRYEFGIAIGSCPEPEMRTEWLQHGGNSFTFSVLESLPRKEGTSDSDYMDELDTLLAMCRDKND